jgi:putative nucleotidyltransferase with HDIG domain
MIPSAKECLEFMNKYEMLENIKAHSIMVEKVANIIAKGLIDTGANLMLEKITAGALLHDIGKSLCLNTKEDHAAKGAEICVENQLYEIADIVGEHVILKNYDPEADISEKEIIYYADKRVNHDRVVSLEDRLEYLLERYGRHTADIMDRIRENMENCKDVERKLFEILRFKPEALADMVTIP